MEVELMPVLLSSIKGEDEESSNLTSLVLINTIAI
jgi:hypothetical protein